MTNVIRLVPRNVIARPHRSACRGQHPRCPHCRAKVERHRARALPASVTIELNDEGSIVCTYDPRTGEILDLSNWNGGNVSGRWEEIAEEVVADRMFEGRHD